MTDRMFLSLGWWGYFACAALYVIAGLRTGDALTLAGSACFLGATVAFLIPHHRNAASEEESDR